MRGAAGHGCGPRHSGPNLGKCVPRVGERSGDRPRAEQEHPERLAKEVEAIIGMDYQDAVRASAKAERIDD